LSQRIARYATSARLGKVIKDGTSPVTYRYEADSVFHEGMRVLGVPRLRRGLMWALLLIFGGKAWVANAKADGREVVDD